MNAFGITPPQDPATPVITEAGNVRLAIYGSHEQQTVDQLLRCAEDDSAVAAVLCADGHFGYNQPVGGVVAYRDHISPTGVGWDIGCGVKGVRTDLLAADVDIAAIMDEVEQRISFGVGRPNDEPVDHPVLDAIRNADFAPQRQLATLAAAQLGTVGSGNHYVCLLVDDTDGHLWVTCHFGSRGFGHKTCGGFLSLASGRKFEDKFDDGEPTAPPLLLSTDTDLGQSYIAAMQLAGDYAYAGRDTVIDTVLSILGTHSTKTVHEHHNSAWLEEHFGERLWVVRKGATPAFAGQEGVVGASMGEPSVVLEGTGADRAEDALFSTVHGAGRVMSRTKARGKFKRKFVWVCGNENCKRVLASSGKPGGEPKKGACSSHPQTTPRKRWYSERKTEGVVDWDTVRSELAAAGIELRGADADEAPEVYKRLPEVLAAHGSQIRVNHRLRPVGVAMAPRDTYDPFKD